MTTEANLDPVTGCPCPTPFRDMIKSCGASCETLELMEKAVISAAQEIESCCDPTFETHWWALVEERHSTVYVVFMPGGSFTAPVAGGDLVMATNNPTATGTLAGQKLHWFSHGMQQVGDFGSVGTGPFGTGAAPLANDNLPIQLTFAQTNAHANQSVGGSTQIDQAVLVDEQYLDFFAIGAGIEVGAPFTVPAGSTPVYNVYLYEGDASYENRIKKALYALSSLDIDVQIGSGTNSSWRMGPISDWTSQYGEMGEKAYTHGQPMPGAYRKFVSWLQTNSRPRVTVNQDSMGFSLALPPALTIQNKTANPTTAANVFVPVILHLYGVNVCLSEMAFARVKALLDNPSGAARRNRRGRR